LNPISKFLAAILAVGLPATALARTPIAECPATWPGDETPKARLISTQLWDREGRIDDSPPPSTSHHGKEMIDHWPMAADGRPIDLRCIYVGGRQLTLRLPSNVRECQISYHQAKLRPLTFTLDRAMCEFTSSQPKNDAKMIRHEAIDATLTLDGLALGRTAEEISEFARDQGMVATPLVDGTLSLKKEDSHWHVLFATNGQSVEVIKQIQPEGGEGVNAFQGLLQRYGSPSSRDMNTENRRLHVNAEIWNWGKTGVRLEFRPSDGTGTLDAYNEGALHLVADRPATK